MHEGWITLDRLDSITIDDLDEMYIAHAAMNDAERRANQK